MNKLTEQYRITSTHFFFWNTVYSQWFSLKDKPLIVEDGNKFWTAEHYMMYHKARVFNDKKIMFQILNGDGSPKRVKALGRKIANFDDRVWKQHRMDIVTQGNYLKFTQNPDLLETLKEHKSLTLVEASPVDKIWGIGLHFDNEDVLDETKWQGENLLGIAIMNAREKILMFDDEYFYSQQPTQQMIDAYEYFKKRHLEGES